MIFFEKEQNPVTRLRFCIVVTLFIFSHYSNIKIFGNSADLPKNCLRAYESTAPVSSYDTDWFHIRTSDENVLSLRIHLNRLHLTHGSARLTGDLSEYKGGTNASNILELKDMQLISSTTEKPNKTKLVFNIQFPRPEGAAHAWGVGEYLLAKAKDLALRAVKYELVEYTVTISLDQSAPEKLTSFQMERRSGKLKKRKEDLLTLNQNSIESGLFNFSQERLEISGPVAKQVTDALVEKLHVPVQTFYEGFNFRHFRVVGLDEPNFGFPEPQVIVPKGLTPAQIVDTLNGLLSAGVPQKSFPSTLRLPSTANQKAPLPSKGQ